MAIELGVGYVSIVPSAKGLRQEIAREFGEIEGDAEVAGDQAGERFGGGFAAKAKLALAAAGLAIGASLVKGTLDAINQEAANDELAARLGLDPQTAALAGSVAGSLYADAYGESLSEVNSAIEAIAVNLGGLDGIGADGLELLGAQALDVSRILGEDVSRSVRGVGQLINTGLAADAEEGFDLLVAAAQKLPAEMRGELIDTVEEYSGSFAELGLTGSEALASISRSLEFGARNTDLAADALKEFSIRSIDGSKLTVEAYEALGLSAEQTMAAIAGGGAGARAATIDVFDALFAVGDQVEQERLGVALFGTQFEDLGRDAVAALNPALGGLGDIGTAAEDAGDILNDNLAVRFEALKRTGFQGLAAVGEQVIPVLETIVGGVEQVVAAFGENGLAGVTDLVREKLEPVFAFISDNAPVFAFVGGAILSVLVPAFVAWAISAGAAAIATIAAAAPVIAIGLAIGALAAAVVYAYQNWDFFRTAVDAVAGFIKNTLVPAIVSVVGWIADNLVPAIVSVVGWILDHLIPAIVSVAGFFVDLGVTAYQLHQDIVDVFEAIVGFVRTLPGRLLSAGAGIWDFLTKPFRDAMNAIRDLWNSTIGGFNFTVPDWIPGVGGNGFTIPTLHDGGTVPGRPGSEHLYLLEAGETVISAGDTRAMMDIEPGQQGRQGPLIGTLITQQRPLLEELMEVQALHPAAA